MLRNYLTVALRTLRRHLGYAAINVIGLALGMAACLIIGLYVDDELSYDRFHEHADRIVVIGTEWGSFDNNMQITSYAVGDVLATDVPGIQQVVRTAGGTRMRDVRRTDGSFEGEVGVLMADSTFFEVFSFPLIEGNPDTVLDAPQQAVITEATAHAFFGDSDPLGETLTFEHYGETRTVIVAGVAENPPRTSTLQFGMVAPIALAPPDEGQRAWGSFSWHVYALRDLTLDMETLNQRLEQVTSPHTENISASFVALPLPDLYLSDYYDGSGFSGQRRYVYLFSTIALLILLVAGINYVNLVTAQGQRRAREVGVRKTVGAQRTQLAGQFLSETALLSFLALAVGLGLVQVALPGFNTLLGTELALDGRERIGALTGLSAFVLSVGIAAGAYPAFVLSRFQPTEVLRGRSRTGGGTSWLRRGLVVMQFTVSTGLVLCTAVIYQQLNYMQSRHLGFDGEQVVTVNVRASAERQQAIKQEIARHPGVERVAIADAPPGGFNVTFKQEPQHVSSAAQTEQETVTLRPARVDADYVETMGMQLLVGRGFSDEQPSDRTHAYMLNRAAVEAMGWTLEEAVGKPFNFGRGTEAPDGEVVGVVENFHIESLHDPIDPVVLQMEGTQFASSNGILAIRLAPDAIAPAMEHIREVTRTHIPDRSFEYTFLDDKFDAMYRSEAQLAQMFMVFAGIALVVACLGLLGLMAYAAERRTKEIAIRKALGASVRSILALLSKEMVVLVAIAFAIGAPVAYWGIQQWLTDFAYRAEVGIWIFAGTAGAALVIAGASMSVHAVRAALADPVNGLRSE